MGAVATTLSADRFSRRNTFAGACVLLAHGPLLVTHLTNLWARPHYQFVGLLLPLAGWLMWQRWPRERVYVPARRLERVLLFGSLGILIGGVWLNSPYLAAISAILAIGFLILHRAGAAAIGELLPVWMLLWFAVPPPLGYDLMIVSSMQALTSRLASLLLDLLSIDHLMSGNVLRIRDSSYFVDEACSGVHSLFALLGYTAVFVVFVSRGVLRSMFLLASSVGWALLANVLRVSVIAAADAWWGMDLSVGWSHDTLGFVTFLIALCLTLSTDRWLHFLGHVVRRFSRSTRELLADAGSIPCRTSVTAAQLHQLRLSEAEQSRSRRPSRGIGIAAICAYSLVLVANVSGLSPTHHASWQENAVASLSEEFMPASVGGMSLREFERIDRDFSSDFGRTSLVWTYADTELGAIRLAVDGSFPGWHELTRCYAGEGWRLDERVVRKDGGDCWVEAWLSKPTGEHAYLIFTLASLNGRVLDASAAQGTSRLIDRMRDEQTLQIQAFAECGGPVDDPLREAVAGLFRTALHRCAASRGAARASANDRRDTNG